MTSDVMSMFPVNFIFVAADGEELLDTQFQAWCVAVPRVGEMVIPHAGNQKVRVRDVCYKFVPSPPGDQHPFMQVVNVVLQD